MNVLVTLFLFGADLDLVSLVLPTDRFLVEAFWFLTTRRLEPACVRPERRGLTRNPNRAQATTKPLALFPRNPWPPEPLSPGAPLRPHVCPRRNSFLGKERYNRAWSSKQATGDFHACLYSLRNHPHSGGWSRRLLGAPRKSRCSRAVEARLNGDKIASHYFFSACLSLRRS